MGQCLSTGDNRPLSAPPYNGTNLVIPANAGIPL